MVIRMMCSHGQVSFSGKLLQRGSMYGGSTNVGSRDCRSIVLSGDTFVRLRVTSVGGWRREESSTLWIGISLGIETKILYFRWVNMISGTICSSARLKLYTI